MAYTIRKTSPDPSRDALIKLVQISTGQVSVLTGENDQCSEHSVKWLDATHLAFKVSEYAVEEHSDRSCFPEGGPLWTYVIFDLTTGERMSSPPALDLSQSPNGRYWVTCSSCSAGYVYECACQYVLRDLVTGQVTDVTETLEWPSFLGWSPDSQLMLFSTGSGKETPPVVQLVIIDVTTHETRVITPDDRAVSSAVWAPTGQSLAFIQCQPADDSPSSPQACTLWTGDQYGANLQPIPAEIAPSSGGPARCLTWTPDGAHLVFAQSGLALNTHTIWTVRRDGTDLRPIVVDAYHICYEMRQQP